MLVSSTQLRRIIRVTVFPLNTGAVNRISTSAKLNLMNTGHTTFVPS